MLNRLLALLLVCLAASTARPATNDPGTDPLRTLRPNHPRLLVLDDQMAVVRQRLKTDAEAQALYRQLQAEAERLLTEPPRHYEIGGLEHTLLDVSRDMEGRILLLAGLYRLNNDQRLAARARDEMLAAAQFPDWFPKHFLDTGEMTAALGIGYDWLFDFLTPAERQTIRQAIVAKGLDPGIAGLTGNGRLAGMHNNWVQVCNGGLTLGALAVAEDENARAAQILQLSRVQMEKAMRLFAPDGGFEEGPIYWNYATIYNALYLAGLRSALGTDFGLARATGFDLTGNYRMQIIGPTGKYANFGDASESAGTAPQMLWLAAQFGHPEYAAHEHEIRRALLSETEHRGADRFFIFELLWDRPGGETLAQAVLPAGAKFDRIAAAFLRSGWGDSNAFYVAFKGGSNRSSHGHLDLGTFILDAFDERWGTDLGADSYGLPGYFGTQRWTYYRMRTEGHNTLTVSNQNENLQAAAPLTAFASGADRSFAIADLSKAYPETLADWRRGIQLLNKRAVLVQDEVRPKTAADLVWNFHTRAHIIISSDGTEAELSQGSGKLRARLLSPLPARFEDAAVTIAAPQKPATGVHNLMIRFPQTTEPATIRVLFTAPDDAAPAPVAMPLAQWNS